MMAGRKPKPASVKAVTGNPGRRPIKDVKLPDTGAAKKPEYLESRPRASQLWDEFAPALKIIGTLTKASERLFAMWCSEQAMYEESPEEFVASRITQIRTLAASLGMDPSAAGKFASPTSESEDPTDEFFTGPRLASK